MSALNEVVEKKLRRNVLKQSQIERQASAGLFMLKESGRGSVVGPKDQAPFARMPCKKGTKGIEII